MFRPFAQSKVLNTTLAIFSLLVLGINFLTREVKSVAQQNTQVLGSSTRAQEKSGPYLVTRVLDGDTIEVKIGLSLTKVRLLGINAPETGSSEKAVECFSHEASVYLNQLLNNQQIYLQADSTQSDQDKYGRYLRYIFLNNDLINQKLIQEGYAYEYTYDNPYTYQTDFQAAQTQAKENFRGLWSSQTCNGHKVLTTNNSQPTSDNCVIKGNISLDNKKIYHLPTCRDYQKTTILPKYGERWFCTETEAQAAGWHKAASCQ